MRRILDERRDDRLAAEREAVLLRKTAAHNEILIAAVARYLKIHLPETPEGKS